MAQGISRNEAQLEAKSAIYCCYTYAKAFDAWYVPKKYDLSFAVPDVVLRISTEQMVTALNAVASSLTLFSENAMAAKKAIANARTAFEAFCGKGGSY
jgi:LmbE family N-acetylglucosaminyl deacetylase